MTILKATSADSQAIIHLLNCAYRGEPSKQGWTTEAHLISGDVRTNEDSFTKVMDEHGSVILKCCTDDGRIVGTVNLQQHGSRIYLGMFAVEPNLQGKGIGKQLLKAAENHTINVGCTSIYMHVISIRHELVDWYKRHGYIDTGKRIPFHEDQITGRHLQSLEFAVLEKAV
jgi:ribosomal protein S18 acetylase RimI-like enzyme